MKKYPTTFAYNGGKEWNPRTRCVIANNKITKTHKPQCNGYNGGGGGCCQVLVAWSMYAVVVLVGFPISRACKNNN